MKEKVVNVFSLFLSYPFGEKARPLTYIFFIQECFLVEIWPGDKRKDLIVVNLFLLHLLVSPNCKESGPLFEQTSISVHCFLLRLVEIGQVIIERICLGSIVHLENSLYRNVNITTEELESLNNSRYSWQLSSESSFAFYT